MKTLGYVGWGGWVGWLGLAWFGLALSLTLLHILWKQAEGDGEIFYTFFMDLEQMRLWMAKLEQCVMNFQMDAFACVPHDCGPHGGRGDGRPGQVPGTALCLLVRVSGHTLPGAGIWEICMILVQLFAGLHAEGNVQLLNNAAAVNCKAQTEPSPARVGEGACPEAGRSKKNSPPK